MNECKSFASTCDEQDVRPIRRYLRRTEEPACAGCRAAMERMGADFTLVERRGADRPFTPPWLAGLTARDMTDAA